MDQRTKPPEFRIYDARSRRTMPLDEWTELLRREAAARRLWVRIGLSLTVVALLATIALRIWRG
jgi:hypothetical protein